MKQQIGRSRTGWLLVFLVWAAWGFEPGTVAAETTSGPPESQTELSLPISDPSIVVLKQERRLQLYSGNDLLREVPIGLGFQPEGDKNRQGDGATPEGEYRVCIKNPQSSFYLSLGLDYPNRDDARRGLDAGLVSRGQYERILSALDAKTCPPWNTALGGEIFVHGNGARNDWTLGCVALEDRDMKELFAAVPVSTKVTIRP